MTEAVHGLPPLLQVGMTVAVVPPPLKDTRWHRVESVGPASETGQLVGLAGISTIGGAEELVGRTLLVARGELPHGYELRDADALLGREVADERWGSLGAIREVMRGVANDVWVIQGPYGELLVPVVDEVVSEVDPQGGIRITLPAGIIDEGVA